jgi:DNA primase
VEGPFDSLLAWQWGYQAICCYGTSPGYAALEKLKAALETDLLQKALVCFDADPTRQALDGTTSQGAGPKAAGEILKFLATPKAQLLSLPPGFKDIASLGEVENGRALLAGAFERAAPDLIPILIPERR